MLPGGPSLDCTVWSPWSAKQEAEAGALYYNILDCKWNYGQRSWQVTITTRNHFSSRYNVRIHIQPPLNENRAKSFLTKSSLRSLYCCRAWPHESSVYPLSSASTPTVVPSVGPKHSSQEGSIAPFHFMHLLDGWIRECAVDAVKHESSKQRKLWHFFRMDSDGITQTTLFMLTG